MCTYSKLVVLKVSGSKENDFFCYFLSVNEAKTVLFYMLCS
jgi:hypothetical protein